jgi:hypothetical protein
MMLCSCMKELDFIIVVLILFVIRIGVILNSWDRFSHCQVSEHSLYSRGFQLHVPSGALHAQGCRRSYAVRYSVSRFVAMEANYGRASGRSLGVRRTSRTSDKSRCWSGNHRTKITSRRQRRFDLLKVCGKESGVNVFLVCIETGHVKRTYVVGDIGSNSMLLPMSPTTYVLLNVKKAVLKIEG